MPFNKLSRRGVVAGGVAAGLVAAPFVRSANAAGTLTIGMWDHWVPGANDVQTAIIKEWSDKNKVDVKIDYITSQGNKLLLSLAAESQSKSGHDIMEFTNWQAAQYATSLEPVNDVVKRVLEKNGPVSKAVESIGFQDGRWLGVPMSRGSLLMGCTARFDMIKEYAGVDVQALYPAGKPPNDADWTWDAFLAVAEKCHKAGHEFGLPLGLTTDSYLWVGALFQAFGAELMNAKGDITVRTDKVKQVMEFGKRISQFCPADAQAWDDASNNKALISGKAALIFNPPSAWAVAKRDAPQVAEKCWFIGFPKGPAGRFNPTLPRFYGIWNFSKNKDQAKSLLEFLAMRPNAEKQVAVSQGYDLPPYVKFNDFKTWDEEGPPKGALTHYPIKGGDQQPGVVAWPAPPLIAAQIEAQAIIPQMVTRYARGGESMDKVLAWAENELEGLKRT